MATMQVPFTLAADPGTDLWKKPPSTDSNNGMSSITTHQILLLHNLKTMNREI